MFSQLIQDPWARGMYYAYSGIKIVQKWALQFQSEKIISTCGGIHSNEIYTRCFIPNATAFLDEADLGAGSVALVALAGTQVLQTEKNRDPNKNSRSQLSDELVILHLTLFTLSRLEVCRATTSLDSEQKEIVQSKMVSRGKTYLQNAKLELARMLTNVNSTLYQNMLKQYEDSLATYSAI